MTAVSRVALVGAGPGHPGLLTLRAVELLQQADLVLYDRLVSPAVLAHAAASARCVCIDDLPGQHPHRWPHIHEAMITAARQGQRVVRLKGGDPMVFGRGAEEVQALREAGLAFEIVPGVTAGLGATAFADIPATHRQHASAVAFITGHEWPGKPDSRLDWPALARFPGTLVFYMGVARLPALVEILLAHGKNPSTPAALIQHGTLPTQRTIRSPLSDLASAAESAAIAPPALVVIGPVVECRQGPSWFESLPLFGQRVLVTRPLRQAGDMARRVEELGGEPVLLPFVDVSPPDDWSAVDAALDRLPQTDWVVFTSSNGVDSFLTRLRHRGRDLRALGHIQLAAIGPATAESLRAFHLEADLVPETFNSEGLAAALFPLVRGQRVLLARADRGLDLLRNVLAEVAEVEQVAVYRQTDANLSAYREPLLRLEAGEITLVALTSSNIAHGLARALGAAGRRSITDGRTRLVSISPRTSEVLRSHGLPVAAEALEYTINGILEAMIQLAAATPQ